MGARGECQATGCQPGRVCPAEGLADRAACTSALLCHSSIAQHCKFAWSELCNDKLFLVSELVCFMFVIGGQGWSVPVPDGIPPHLI